MTNREKLSNMALYDLLYKMNEAMKWEKMRNDNDIHFCIMDILDNVGQTFCNDIQISNRDACSECIEKYLNRKV